MKLKQFEFLVALDKYGTISRVAQKLYTSQPAISVSIKELETELGYSILSRSNRGTEFTPQGRMVLEQAIKILQCVEAIQGLTGYSDDKLVGTLRVAALPHLCNTLFADLQMQLMVQYPSFNLVLEGLVTETVVRMVENGSVSLGVIQTAEMTREGLEKRIQNGKLRYKPLFTDPLYFVVAEGHPLLEKDKITIEDLLPYPYVVFGDGINEHVLELTESTGYPDQIRRFYETIRMRKYMKSFHAVTVLPLRALLHGNENYSIKFHAIRVEGIDWATEVGLIHNGSPYTEAEEYIVHELESQFSERPAP